MNKPYFIGIIVMLVGLIMLGTTAVVQAYKISLMMVHNNCPSCHIAIVKPIFTNTAYNHSFYVFYKKHIGDTITNNDIHLLTNKISKGWGFSSGAYKFFKPHIANNTINVIDDIDVHYNTITKYHTLIILHSEYMTDQEYNNLEHFVYNGGTMLVFDSNSFYAEVSYHYNKITLVRGHGWLFNGTHAIKDDIGERWYNNNTSFIGSHYDGKHQYGESNKAVNPSECIIKYKDSICTYKHQYGKGIVYHTGISASQYIHELPELQDIIHSLVR